MQIGTYHLDRKQRTKDHLNLAGVYSQGLFQTVFNINIPLLSTVIKACPNSIFSKIKTTNKRNSRLLIMSVKKT